MDTYPCDTEPLLTPPQFSTELPSQPNSSPRVASEFKHEEFNNDSCFSTHPRPTPNISTLIPDNYEQKNPEDEHKHEIDSGDRVRQVYLDEARGVDVLLVLAGLFSAVVTAFVVESARWFRDSGPYTNTLLEEVVNLQRAAAWEFYSGPGYHTRWDDQRRDRWINGLWGASLVCSISTALVATVARQWMQHYIKTVSDSPQRVRNRQLYHDSFERWGVPTIVSLIPLLLYLAVFLFLWGLFIFYCDLNPPVAWFIAISGIACAFYITSTLLLLFFPDCPHRALVAGWVYRTLLFLHKKWTLFIHRMEHHAKPGGSFHELLSRIHAFNPYQKDFAWPQRREISLLEDQAEHLDVEALMWMATSPHQSVQFLAAQALGDLDSVRYRKQVKQTKLSSSGLGDAAISIYQPDTALSAETFDHMFRTYYRLTKWRKVWLESDQTPDRFSPAVGKNRRMAGRAVDVLRKEYAAVLAAQKRYKTARDIQNIQNPADSQKGDDVLADLGDEVEVRSRIFNDHAAEFGNSDQDLWLEPDSQDGFDFLHLFFSVFEPGSSEYQEFIGGLGAGVPGSRKRKERVQAFIATLGKTGKDDGLARALIQATLSPCSIPHLTENISTREESCLGTPAISHGGLKAQNGTLQNTSGISHLPRRDGIESKGQN